MTAPMITPADLVAHLRTDVEVAGGVRAWSRQTGINQATVSQTLNGHIDAPECIANALGYVRLVRFQPLRRVA